VKWAAGAEVAAPAADFFRGAGQWATRPKIWRPGLLDLVAHCDHFRGCDHRGPWEL